MRCTRIVLVQCERTSNKNAYENRWSSGYFRIRFGKKIKRLNVFITWGSEELACNLLRSGPTSTKSWSRVSAALTGPRSFRSPPHFVDNTIALRGNPFAVGLRPSSTIRTESANVVLAEMFRNEYVGVQQIPNTSSWSLVRVSRPVTKIRS